MPDYGSVVADKAIAQTSRKVRSVYRQAGEELHKKLSDFEERYRSKSIEMLKKVDAGEITKGVYQSWLKGQVFIGKQWKAKIDSAARIMNDANKEAVSIVNLRKMDVFAENYNFTAYGLERQAKGAVSFNIYDEKTVARLL